MPNFLPKLTADVQCDSNKEKTDVSLNKSVINRRGINLRKRFSIPLIHLGIEGLAGRINHHCGHCTRHFDISFSVKEAFLAIG